ncbi:MAG: PEGA domain-containing protein [Myxococcales bacterium]|nr:PEGA domain-containing protein [Myxococcales bacterium]
MKLRNRVALAVAITLVATGCPTPTPRTPEATLIIACAIEEAQVYVDEAYVGRAADTRRRPLALGAGPHRIELRADGKFSAYRTVTLARGDRATVEVALHDDLDQTPRPVPGRP